MDEFAQYKEAQKQGWAHFIPLEMMTTLTAAHLVEHSGISRGQRVLDVACGTGVVAITAARRGAHVSGLDLTPQLLGRAQENTAISGAEVAWHEGDVENLPFKDGEFDAVLSQFGHMFAPRPEKATSEMLRVLKPGGTIAFSTWPPEMFVGRTFSLVAQHMPPPPGVASPTLWGDPAVIRERLGSAVDGIAFARGCMKVPALSLQHHRTMFERTAGPVIKLVETLKEKDPVALSEFRKQYESVASEHFQDNAIHQDYLMTRALKKN